VFDLADAQLKGKNDGYRDNELSVSELLSLFKGDTRVADRYLEDIDEYAFTREPLHLCGDQITYLLACRNVQVLPRSYGA